MSTRAEILAQITSLLPDNNIRAISPADLRAVVNNLANSCNNSTDEGTPTAAAAASTAAHNTDPGAHGSNFKFRALVSPLSFSSGVDTTTVTSSVTPDATLTNIYVIPTTDTNTVVQAVGGWIGPYSEGSTWASVIALLEPGFNPYGNSGGVMFLTDAPVAEIQFGACNNRPVTVSVDWKRPGAPVNLTNDGVTFGKFSFGNSDPKRVMVFCMGGGPTFLRIAVGSAYSVWPAPRLESIHLYGDSVGEGFSSTTGDGGYVHQLSRLLQANVIPVAYQGTGYIANASTHSTYASRMANHAALSRKPISLMFQTSVNDTAYPLVDQLAAARATWTQARSLYGSQIPIIGIGRIGHSDNGSTLSDETAYAAEFSSWASGQSGPAYFIPTCKLFRSANSGLYNASVHPNNAGHRLLAEYIASQLRSIVAS